MGVMSAAGGAVDGRLQSILDRIGSDEIATVAASALGVPAVRLETAGFDEIAAHHSDARTIGIVRAVGTAAANGTAPPQAWSAVAKVVDLAVEGQFNGATKPENEGIVYERGLFAGSGLPFRPAHCYNISRLSPTLKILWLEDLTSAKAPPFEIDILLRMVRHLGEWNAVTAAAPPHIDFPVFRSFPARRWNHWQFAARVAELETLAANPIVTAMYSRQPLSLAAEFVSVVGRLVEQSKSLRHTLAFSDAPLGNFFFHKGETVAVDWSGLGMDPLGGDGGCFIGSAFTWGQHFVDVMSAERELFDAYAMGLAEGGMRDDLADVRRAYLAHAAFYLGTILITPTIFEGPLALLPREFLERRYGMPIEALAEESARVIDLLPSYVEEARALLDGKG